MIETGSYKLDQDEIIEFGRKYAPVPYHTDPDAAKEAQKAREELEKAAEKAEAAADSAEKSAENQEVAAAAEEATQEAAQKAAEEAEKEAKKNGCPLFVMLLQVILLQNYAMV